MTNYRIAIGIVIGLLFICLAVLFCVLLIKLYIKKIKEYNAKEVAFQKTVSQTIIETQEQVLQNISQDLHDDAGQQLTYINFQLENLKLDSPELKNTLEPLSQSVNQLSQTIRGISHGLNNQLVMQQDVIKAIAAEVKRLQKNTKTSLSYSFEELGKKEFTVNEKIFIYRIFQECMNNCFKHAKASEIKISISIRPQFEMKIEDNGQGFNQDKTAVKTSLGLTNMKARAQSINYQLVLTSNPGLGTTITLTENTKTD
ncbi:sensor histidine kinase [Flavobacterium phycosphaerae]|uniref:sensor histidine kinase n=1 Tax=Flavobacterium phycosphaerae TaxID=2697515 RepID=UPI001389A36F|nr:ATP-binding protein [Flavobacterium phycosphaerae]